MRSIGRIVATAALASAVLLSYPARADVKAGVDAWQAGNFTAAIKEWRPLADKGDPDAQFNLGQAYKLGRGVPTDLKIAQDWYQKAAQQGHDQAQANLGLILFQNGEREAAMPWISKAADHGDARAQYVLGTALFNGDIVAKDWPRAYALMTRAAAKGLPQATTSLTEMDGFIPPAEREKGVALARDIERKEMASGSAPAPAAKPVQASSIRPTVLPPSQPVAARPATAAKPATPPKPAPVQVATPRPAVAPSPGGKWQVQLGAYGSVAGAKGQWSAISRRVGALSGLQPSFEPAGNFTRLRVGPFADRATADRVCAAAKSAGQACIAVAR
jgi:cell division septation protein DedD